MTTNIIASTLPIRRLSGTYQQFIETLMTYYIYIASFSSGMMNNCKLVNFPMERGGNYGVIGTDFLFMK